MTEATTKKPRGRQPKTRPEQPDVWQVGTYTASIEDGYYVIRNGKHLLFRDSDKRKFDATCGLIESASRR